MSRADADGHTDAAASYPGAGAGTSNVDVPSNSPQPTSVSMGMEDSPQQAGQHARQAQNLLGKVMDVLDGAAKETLNEAKSFSEMMSPLGPLAQALVPELQPSNSTEKAGMVAASVALVAVPMGEEAKGGEVLTRFGKEVESAEKLGAQAAAAEEKIGIHGVSTTARPNPRTPGSSALRSEVEKTFNVHNTGSDYHRTVELMKPVTQAVADAFNRVFGRIP